MDQLNWSDMTRYLWGLDLSQTLQGAGGVGGLLAVVRDGVTHAASADANGNITEYTNLTTGALSAHYAYDGFGNTIATSGPFADTFNHRFSSKYLDAGIGWYYYGYRFYDPINGRWPNRDPIEEEGGLGLYGMVGNDPMTQLDPLGLRWERYMDFNVGYDPSTGMALVQPRWQNWWEAKADINAWKDIGPSVWRKATNEERQYWMRYKSGDQIGARIGALAYIPPPPANRIEVGKDSIADIYVAQCSIAVAIIHGYVGHPSQPTPPGMVHRWHFSGECNAGGYIGCQPFRVNSTLKPPHKLLPGLPAHMSTTRNMKIPFGPLEDEYGGRVMDEGFDQAMFFEQLFGSQANSLEDLCKNACCDNIAISIYYNTQSKRTNFDNVSTLRLSYNCKTKSLSYIQGRLGNFAETLGGLGHAVSNLPK